MSDLATTLPVSPRPLAGVAVRGMAWMTLVVIITKLAGFVSQWILGLLLSPADFGVFALVTVAQNFIEGFRDIGAARILIQRGDQYDRLAAPIFKLSLAANAVAIAALLGGAPLLAHYYHEPQLLWLIPLTALAIPWTTTTVIHKAKLNRDLNYRAVGKIESALPILQYGLTILFAWAGLGVLSFVLPFTLVSIVQMAAYRRAAGPIPRGDPVTSSVFWEIFHQSKWLMLGAYGMGLVLRGDYLVLGRMFEHKADLGIYYFGFQLAASIGMLFTSGLQNVLMPAFSTLNREPARLRQAFLRACRLLLLAATLLAGCAIAVSPELLQLLWHGKWNGAALTTILILFSLPFKLLAPVASSALEAHGLWRKRTLILLVDGGLICASAGLGAWLGGIAGASWAVAIQRCLSGLVQTFISARIIGVAPSALFPLLGAGLLPFLCGCGLLLALPHSLVAAPLGLQPLVLSAALKLAVFGLGWLAAGWLLNRPVWHEFRQLILKKTAART